LRAVQAPGKPGGYSSLPRAGNFGCRPTSFRPTSSRPTSSRPTLRPGLRAASLPAQWLPAQWLPVQWLPVRPDVVPRPPRGSTVPPAVGRVLRFRVRCSSCAPMPARIGGDGLSRAVTAPHATVTYTEHPAWVSYLPLLAGPCRATRSPPNGRFGIRADPCSAAGGEHSPPGSSLLPDQPRIPQRPFVDHPENAPGTGPPAPRRCSDAPPGPKDRHPLPRVPPRPSSRPLPAPWRPVARLRCLDRR
jgi:hypothetical protein